MLVGWSAQADTITLRDEAYVKGPQVLLGEVADIQGEHAESLARIEISPAALPGSARRLDASLVSARVRGSGIGAGNVEFIGRRPVLATMMHLDITPGMIAEDLRQFVKREMPWDPQPTIIDVTPPPRAFVVSAGELTIRWRPDPLYDYLGLGTFRGEILVDGVTQKSIFCKATVKTYGEVLVALTNISRNESLHAGNTRLERRDLSSLEPGAFFSPRDVQGLVAKSSIYRGQVLTEKKLVSPQLVKRNQIVEVETRIGTLTIRTTAKSTASGAAGDLISCQTLNSKQHFVGRLRRDGVVVVH